MPRRTEIAIDPNVRVRGSMTYAGFEDVLAGYLSVGDTVVVRELESDLEGTARVAEIDAVKELVYLQVDWASLVHRTHEVSPSVIWAVEPPQFRVLLDSSVYMPQRAGHNGSVASPVLSDRHTSAWALAR